jgi:hypothetical protein
MPLTSRSENHKITRVVNRGHVGTLAAANQSVGQHRHLAHSFSKGNVKIVWLDSTPGLRTRTNQKEIGSRLVRRDIRGYLKKCLMILEWIHTCHHPDYDGIIRKTKVLTKRTSTVTIRPESIRLNAVRDHKCPRSRIAT